MNVSKIGEHLQALIANLDEESFIDGRLRAYGLSRSAITRLKTGSYVASGQEEILWKKKVFFKKAVGQDLYANLETRNN